MALFKDILHSDQSLFRNEQALDTEFIPKILPFREKQQRYIASCIAPLLQDRNGKNILVSGSPGIGKTASIKHMFRELEEETSDVIPLYVNCWQKNTTFKVVVSICNELGYNLTHNKNTEELFAIVKNILNKKSAVLCFDEVDKIEDFDFLYSLIQEINKRDIENSILKIIYHVPIGAQNLVEVCKVQRACSKAHYIASITPIIPTNRNPQRVKVQSSMKFEEIVAKFLDSKENIDNKRKKNLQDKAHELYEKFNQPEEPEKKKTDKQNQIILWD